MEEFTIHQIVESDAEELIEFKNLYFHGQDPVEMAVPGVRFQSENTDLVLEAVRTGFAVKLIENETSKVVGYVLGIPTDYSCRVSDFRKAAASVGDVNKTNVLNLIGSVEEKANIYEKYPKEWRKIHVRTLSVHPDYRGQKLGQRLLAAGIEESRKMGFDLITAICSSVYSAKIAASLGMEHISTLTYDEHHKNIGQKLFTPIEPHTELRSYVLKL